MIDNDMPKPLLSEAAPDLAELSIRTVLGTDALANAIRRVIEDLDAETFAAFGNAPRWSEPGEGGSGGRRLDVALGPAGPAGVEGLGVVGAEELGEGLDG